MRLLHADKHTESIGHDGEQFERDEHGAFDLPHELAEKLLAGFSHLWSVAPEPVPTEAAEPVKPKRAPKPKSEPEPQGDGSQGDNSAVTETPAATTEPVKTPADETGSKEGDGDDAPAPEAPKGRASSRKASA